MTRTQGSPGVDPALPSSELLLVVGYHLYLEVVLELLEKVVLLEQLCPVYLAWPAQELVTDMNPTRKLILHKLFL